MKRLLSFLAAAVVLFLPVAATAIAADPVVYTAGHAFKLDVPAGFTSSQQNGNSYPVFVNTPNDYTAYLQIASDAFQGDLKQFVRQEMGGFRNSTAMTNVVFTSTGAITTKTGVQGIRVLMTFNSAKGPMDMAAYYFQKPGEVEVLHGVCFSQLGPQMVPLFDNSANSIVLLK
jgi:hypothetical protein